jgi:pyruvate dehydrogenase E2 component (dihydrolipoamide acetyltransferase)
MMDIDDFTAIINPPDACILAVGRIAPTPVVVDQQIQIKHIMGLTLSCDHRIVDGAVGARFLQTLKTYLQQPYTMLA